MIVSIEKCHHCGACVGSCPKNAIYLNDIVLVFNEECNRCGRCVKVCPVGAIKMEAQGMKRIECDVVVVGSRACRQHDRQVGGQGRGRRPDDREAPGDRRPGPLRARAYRSTGSRRSASPSIPSGSLERSAGPRSYRPPGTPSWWTRSRPATRSAGSSTGCSSIRLWRPTQPGPGRRSC